jgi:hypothetical protein
MRLTIHYRIASTRADSRPHCFSSPTDEFTGVAEAAEVAHRDAGLDGNGATEFMITNEAGETVVHRILRGTSWEAVNA